MNIARLSGDAMHQLLQWFAIRDALLGHNEQSQDVNRALELAAVCNHPDAVWLTKLFAGRDVSTVEEARQVFLACDKEMHEGFVLPG
jgi:hypothetical protein